MLSTHTSAKSYRTKFQETHPDSSRAPGCRPLHPSKEASPACMLANLDSQLFFSFSFAWATTICFGLCHWWISGKNRLNFSSVFQPSPSRLLRLSAQFIIWQIAHWSSVSALSTFFPQFCVVIVWFIARLENIHFLRPFASIVLINPTNLKAFLASALLSQAHTHSLTVRQWII